MQDRQKKSRNGAKLQIALFNLIYIKEDSVEISFISILLNINGAQLQAGAAQLELTVLSSKLKRIGAANTAISIPVFLPNYFLN